jgi:hypothetical protein
MQMLWSPLFAVFSMSIEQAEEKSKIVLDSLEGIKFCIRLLGICDMVTERETFVVFLSKYTGLLQNDREVNSKNICAIKTVLEIGKLYGNHLYDSWLPFL